jgi:hypothetical protein
MQLVESNDVKRANFKIAFTSTHPSGAYLGNQLNFLKIKI